MPTNQPTGLIYRCPECGEFAFSETQTTNTATLNPTIQQWYHKMDIEHADCGKPKEPPCPVKVGGVQGYYLPGDGPLSESSAVAIAFTYAMERGMIVPMFDSDFKFKNYYLPEIDIDCDSLAEAVTAIWPETFKDLEVGDDG